MDDVEDELEAVKVRLERQRGQLLTTVRALNRLRADDDDDEEEEEDTDDERYGTGANRRAVGLD